MHKLVWLGTLDESKRERSLGVPESGCLAVISAFASVIPLTLISEVHVTFLIVYDVVS